MDLRREKYVAPHPARLTNERLSRTFDHLHVMNELHHLSLCLFYPSFFNVFILYFEALFFSIVHERSFLCHSFE